MRTPLKSYALAALFWATAGVVGAATPTPLQLIQLDTFYNLESQQGMPISSVSNSPAGSNGRVPGGQNESGTYNLTTSNQFQSVLTFAAAPSATNQLAVRSSPLLNGSYPFSGQVVEAMQRPRGYSNTTVAAVLRRAQVGALYISRQVDLLFGSPIEVPLTDEWSGALTNEVKTSYWQAEPYTTSAHTNDAGYYWSPNARKVFAIQAGPIQVTWVKRTPYTAATLPTNYVNTYGSQSFLTNGSSIYLLRSVNYVASASAVKPPKQLFWTEREYRITGFPVSVPAGRLGGIHFVYNDNFPKTVAQEFHGPGYTDPTEGSTNGTLQELRTVWYDQLQGGIYAYNFEGRLFVELLGDASPDGQTREHLGYEIVDVSKQPMPADVDVELGERMVPPEADSADNLYASPVQSGGGVYVYRHIVAATGRLNLYADRETSTPNDSIVYWLETGVANLKWPKHYARYAQAWPADVAKYSHYIRPEVATEAEAIATAVQLPTDNVPFIDYQDPLDRPRAKLTPDYKFYTFLDATQPAHRALLRFQAGENVAFERIFSWLDTSLKTTNLLGSVAMNLAEVAYYYNYPVANAAYTNYLAQVAAYGVKYAPYTAYVQALASWEARNIAYTNYLALSSAYVNQQAAYTVYTNWLVRYTAYSAYTNYTAQLAAYNAYTNWQVHYTAYANYSNYTSRLAAYNAYTNWQPRYTAYTNYVAYTNQLAIYRTYTNWQARYTAYTNYQAQYAAYTNQFR